MIISHFFKSITKLQLTQQKKDLFFTLINQLWRIVSGPIVMLLIPLFLTESDQGYWYLFSSLAALSIFADLGFSNIILQFAAHEYAYLKVVDGELNGEEIHLVKLSSFFTFSLKWINTITRIIFPLIYLLGIGFFVKDGTITEYIVSWTIYSIGSLGIFLSGVLLSFLEGLDNVGNCQRIRFITSLVNSLIVVILLLSSFGIFASAIGLLISSFLSFVIIWKRFSGIVKQLVEISKHNTYPWKKELLPLFLRYALSFSSSFFIFQIYTPLMHFFHGPIQSGKVGITNAIVMAIFSISNSWMYSITPRINMLVSRKQWDELDKLFKKRLLLSCVTYSVGALCLVILLYYIPSQFAVIKVFSNRFLPITPILMLVISYFFQLIITAIALYLRAHKQEPFVTYSIFVGAYTLLTTFIIAKYLKTDYFFVGFLTSFIIGFPWAMRIFLGFRKEWHLDTF